MMAASRLPGLLTNHIDLPGTESERAERLLESQFDQRTVGAFTLVATTEGPSLDILPALRLAALRAMSQLPTGQLAEVTSLDTHVAAAQIVSGLTASQAKEHTAAMRAAIGHIDGATTYLTGFAAAEHDMEPILQADLMRGEVLVAIPIAVALLIWTFGTLAFVLPLMFALFTIPTTLGLVYLFALAIELTTYVTNLVGLIGLGIAIDYSLLMVHRFREESSAGMDSEQAIVRTMQTAGRAVVFSGTSVAIGLALLVFLPLPFLRGFGIGGLLIPIVSVGGALTLLPALLAICGSRLDRARLVPRRWINGHADAEGGLWPGLVRFVMKRAWLVATVSTASLLLMAYPTLSMELGPGSRDGLPRSAESIKGLDIVAAAVGAGATVPTRLVIDSGRADGVYDPEFARALGRLMKRLTADPQVAKVQFVRGMSQFVDFSGRYANLGIAGRLDFGAPPSLAFVDRLRGELVREAAFPSSSTLLVGGAPAAGHDFLGLVRNWFPPLVAAILIVTYLLLLRAFRSVLLPLKAIVLNLLSIGAAYGLTVAAFCWGWGARFGLITHPQINAWIPVLVFAILFGLSMDYEVFLVCRMREYWDQGASNAQAVSAGLVSTGRLVTSAGLIMCAAFSGFVMGSIVELQQFGFALAVSILVDVTIVRALLLPASMALFGRWNWFMPDVVARIVGLPRSSR
jgi:RND superfamily putative drug exporter